MFQAVVMTRSKLMKLKYTIKLAVSRKVCFKALTLLQYLHHLMAILNEYIRYFVCETTAKYCCMFTVL